jgi:hypothetical protein
MAQRLVKREPQDPHNAPSGLLQRLRANNRGAPVMPVSFAQALSTWMAEQRKVNRSRLMRVRAAWEMAIEQVPGINVEAARRASVRSVAKTGAVIVTVDHPGLAHELGVVYRGALLAKLRELLAGRDSVSDLKVSARARGRGRGRV